MQCKLTFHLFAFVYHKNEVLTKLLSLWHYFKQLIDKAYFASYKSLPFLPDDIKNVQSTLHRNQSPSPSRGSSRASSSPVSSTSYISDACTSLSKAEDATTATSTSMSSSPVNAGPSSYRAQWVLSRKLSGRSRFSELQGMICYEIISFLSLCITHCIVKKVGRNLISFF